MDPFDFHHPPRPPPSTGESWSTPGPLQWLFASQYDLAQKLAAVLANQQTNKVDILERLQMHRDHHDQRIDDFRGEIIPRLERLESRPSEPERESSLVKSLFGSIGVFLWGVIPWKHLGLMAPGILLAIATNLAPEGTKKFIVAAVKLFWNTQSQ